MRFHKLRTTLAKRLLKGTWYIVACKDSYARRLQCAYEEGVFGAKWKDTKTFNICQKLRE